MGDEETTEWKPTQILDVSRVLNTSMRTAVVETDAGRGFLKAMGGPEGPHRLACEWIGTSLANWFGLRTFDFALVQVGEWNEIRFPEGGRATPGPAFITRAEAGHSWSGDSRELEKIANRQDLTRLIVFDTWIRNRDRYFVRGGEKRANCDNVFLAGEEAGRGRFLLVAMDHTHCLAGPEGLSESIARIDGVKDEAIYGAFPQFEEFFDREEVFRAQRKLREVRPEAIQPILAGLPRQWEVSQEARKALIEFLCQRGRFLIERLPDYFHPVAEDPVWREEER